MLPEVWATKEVIVALIGALAAVMVAGFSVLGILLQRSNSHAKAAREQVQNNHATNLRDDLDGKHSSEMVLLTSLALDVGGIKSDLRLLRKTDTRHSDRLYALEHPDERMTTHDPHEPRD